MEYPKEALRSVINTIKTIGARKGIVITDEQIAKTINISNEQLSQYLQDQNKIPDDLLAQLLSFYGVKVKVFHSILEREVYFPDEEQPESQE